MTEEQELEREDTFEGPEPKSSSTVLSALRKSEHAFRDWQATAEKIDEIYSIRAADVDPFGMRDAELDLFWSSFEVLKPAVYARAPQPVVAPLFKDSKPVPNLTAELLERCAITTFKLNDIQDAMTLVRDDVLFAGRGVLWVRHETDAGHKVCVEHKDRLDFLHEPARTWAEVGWVAGAAWMTRKEMRERFKRASGDAYKDAKYEIHRDSENRDEESRTSTKKAKVWEVWHKADNRVYWVTDGVDVLLDEGKPHLKLSGFFPCPRPAYATLKRRSLVPVPDWERYAVHFEKISTLTRRIYTLLEDVRMKGLIPAGSDVGDAIEQMVRSDDDRLIIPVDGAALLASGGAQGFVQWLPLDVMAQAIAGLIESRTQLINDFYQLSGVSDIMRGATDADETLGAQELKTQFGSVRVREKSTEIQRIAADVVKIVSEIIAEKFPQKSLLEMSQLEIPTRAEIKKRIRDVEKAAKGELEALAKQAQEAAAQAQGVDPAQAEQAFMQAQQQALAKYAPMLAEAENLVAIEDVIDLLRNDRVRSFVFEIESSSTILTDELQEKRSRNEFLSEFTAAQQGLMGIAAMGEQGAKLAGAMLKFALAPYRVGRDLDGAIDEFIKAAPEMAAKAAAEQGEGEELAAANNKLAEAEQMKAQAQMAKVEADVSNKQAENERKIMEIQAKAQSDQAKAMAEAEKLRQSADANLVKAEEALAKVDLIRAQTMQALAKAGVEIDNQALDEFKSLKDIEFRESDQAMAADRQAMDSEMRLRGEDRSDRQQGFNERQAMGGEE